MINCIIGGIILVYTLVHRLLCTHVVTQVLSDKHNPSTVTTVSMVVLGVLVPVIPCVLILMGMSVGVVSIFTMGALTTQCAEPTTVHVRDPDVRLLTAKEYEVRIMEDYS